MPIDQDVQLKVDAHVLIQLGRELVTDVEQAILECVKNSYDADSPGCFIEIDTKEQKTRIETGTVGRLRTFIEPSEGVVVELCDEHGAPLSDELDDEAQIQRRLTYDGRITIEDNGDGLSEAQLKSSWLVISNSNKRSDSGKQKQKTKLGRTPLGDKGLGRLGSMKLGDILLIESATSAQMPIATAQFRWTDCESARTIDEIPVFLSQIKNTERFKGTRVSILGLRDRPDWARPNRIFDIARSLAKLISPFEATSTFPVQVSLDNHEQSLVTITDDVLKQAIAEFVFEWKEDEAGGGLALYAEARFKKRLFMSRRTKKLEERTKQVFEIDNGSAFAEFLPNYKRLAAYDRMDIQLSGDWFITLKRKFSWSEIKPTVGAPVEDPGPLRGAFYFFHLDSPDEEGAASGIGVDKSLIKGMSGISILRDGFRVRSQGDWLELAAGMTSGSTYYMRPDNTVGYFSLSGEQNFKLTEKSDREGFVEDAAFRGFFQIAQTCRNFANDALENVRRALDEHAKHVKLPESAPVARTTEGSLLVVEENLRSVREAQHTAETVASELGQQIEAIRSGNLKGEASSGQAMKLANNAIRAMDVVRSQLAKGTFPELDLIRIRQEIEEQSDRAVSLLESAAVGLSARGLAHELRTHLTEIRQRTATLERLAKKRDGSADTTIPVLRGIRTSCNAIANAVALIDPMLPRTRTTKETMDLRDVIENYINTRQITLDRAGITTSISGASKTVRANRSRLIQVIDNLFRNSVYWLRRGQTTGEVTRPMSIAVRLTSTGFRISDSGPGVDPRYEDTLFEMFVSAKPEREGGQGLGLFIIQQLLQIDGCEIRLLPDRNEDERKYKFEVDLSRLVKA